MMDNKTELSASDLNKLFSDSKSQLAEQLADCRTNNNLFQGNHFQKKGSKSSRALENLSVSEDSKIRITKNHINTICKFIINSILANAPDGIIDPKNPLEIQDQKSAELHKVIWEDYKEASKFKKTVRSLAHAYVISGEVFVNQFWDDNIGRKLSPTPIYDIGGNLTGEQPQFEGDAVNEIIFPSNMRGDPGAKSIDESMWLGYEKMVDIDVIKKLAPGDEELHKSCQSDTDETYKIFDSVSGGYSNVKGKVLLRQIYFRPCLDKPDGQFAFFSNDKVIVQGPLPKDQNGNVFFPIKYVGFDEIPMSPRCASIIKQIRPEQMEVNRCASSIAQIQTTLGFDKLIMSTGGEAQAGANVHGVRVIKVPGGKQNGDIIQGKGGDQFLATLQQNISEMYSKTGVPENWDDKAQDVDVMASLYKNMRQKTRFSLYSEKFTEFIVELVVGTLRLKKAYMKDEAFFRVAGKMEYQNIAEFRAMDDLGYQVKVTGGSEDLESRFGKYMGLMQSLQYLGTDLDNNTKGLILKNMPFINGDEIHAHLTQPYEIARNIMLSLDRGEQAPITEVSDPLYISEQLNFRIFKPDFKYLNQTIQAEYKAQAAEYNKMYNEKLAQVQRAEQGFIPADGPTVPVDGMYEMTPDGKSKRVQIPQSSLNWLIEQMKAQSQAFGNIQTLPLGTQAQVAEQYNAAGMNPAAQQPNMSQVPQDPMMA